MKYVVVIDPISQIESPILFPAWLYHKNIVPEGWEVVSAGHVKLVMTGLQEFSVSGESRQLGVKNRGDTDADLIKKVFNFEVI